MEDDELHYHTTTPKQWEQLKPFAREMRHHPTLAEDHLWQFLRRRGIGGVRFRRQHAIAGFIVDFICISKQLIVEVDGGIHALAAHQLYDQERQSQLEAQGYRVLRFTNEAVLGKTDSVLDEIRRAVRESEAC